MAIYEVMYSTKTASNDELSFSDIVLVEAETHEALTEKVVGLIRKQGPPGKYYVDSIGGNPYETRSEKRIANIPSNSVCNYPTDQLLELALAMLDRARREQTGERMPLDDNWLANNLTLEFIRAKVAANKANAAINV